MTFRGDFHSDLPRWFMQWSSMVVYFDLLRVPITSNYNICIKKLFWLDLIFPTTFHGDLPWWPSVVISAVTFRGDFRSDLPRWFPRWLPRWSSAVVYFDLLRVPITSNYNICIKKLFWLDLIFPTTFHGDLPWWFLQWPSAVIYAVIFYGGIFWFVKGPHHIQLQHLY